jgi:predicted transcriptional regulator
MTLTVNEFAASMNVDYGTANSLLKFLVSRNLAKKLANERQQVEESHQRFTKCLNKLR